MPGRRLQVRRRRPLDRLVTMFIDYAQLMAEDGQPMSMAGWLGQTDRFLEFSRCDVLPGKGKETNRAARSPAARGGFRGPRPTLFLPILYHNNAKKARRKDWSSFF
ncbi:MAG: RhuM family protein [Oscillospiraceae bacterium]|nr:RhuM family protein [Oscillospiraceae bacterium]